MPNDTSRSPRNRTLSLSDAELVHLKSRLLTLKGPSDIADVTDRTIHQDIFETLGYLPDSFVDLLFVDPPYNLDKTFNVFSFKELTSEQYESWLDSWVKQVTRLLKPHASIYICGDWRSSAAIFDVSRKYFKIQNRITFEREKGRGAKSNWKSCSEDIWFCTLSDSYHFNVEAVKMRRKVIAPYTDAEGNPKDWKRSEEGNYRNTYPSNIWTDITIPFWSMPENTPHPTQKPEKLVAKIILASSKPGDMIFDPFLGSGTTSVVAKKLGRRYVGVEIDEMFCCLAEKRLELAEHTTAIQGYSDGVFWERNTLNEQSEGKAGVSSITFPEGLYVSKLV